MIEYNKALYVSEDIFVHEELLKHHHDNLLIKHHHDNLLIKHFDADKINELLGHKYY